MRLIRNGLVAVLLALGLFLGASGIASAHPSPGSAVPGAGGWLDHAGRRGDGLYSYVIADTRLDGQCAHLQAAWTGRPMSTLATNCAADTHLEGDFRAPAGGVFFRVCRGNVCDSAKPYSDNV
jgi:hypothetical protein